VRCDSQAEVGLFLGQGRQLASVRRLKDKFGLCRQIVPQVLFIMIADKEPCQREIFSAIHHRLLNVYCELVLIVPYVAAGYLWNSGNFLFHAATMLKEIERYEPLMAEAARGSIKAATRDLGFLRLAPDAFARAPKKSIDYAVMERTKRAVVVPADLGWSDIGSRRAVWDLLPHDQAGNATEGPVVLFETRTRSFARRKPC
jgi:hypothetical protein